jgi:hypothetical protein
MHNVAGADVIFCNCGSRLRDSSCWLRKSQLSNARDLADREQQWARSACSFAFQRRAFVSVEWSLDDYELDEADDHGDDDDDYDDDGRRHYPHGGGGIRGGIVREASRRLLIGPMALQSADNLVATVRAATDPHAHALLPRTTGTSTIKAAAAALASAEGAPRRATSTAVHKVAYVALDLLQQDVLGAAVNAAVAARAASSASSRREAAAAALAASAPAVLAFRGGRG